ncbi:CHAT domain-containing protein [Boeremia exigua]|uniref:CHAT domain-containing protein n=1 Tax=Boeremia exigua TaxID=749465 RepID=UPI001E8EBAD6|nr:CHAT domain-containing protein [Boeremia exigua]KAH6616783.1 CHAT domain-containing protein [Boeremia exigua]
MVDGDSSGVIKAEIHQELIRSGPSPHLVVPTGPLSQMPLHAAGVYGTGSQDTVLDRCMSSYASSVRALIYGRQSKLRKALPSDQKLALLVSMQHTPNLSWNSDLPFASEGVESVTGLVKSINLDPIRPPPRRKDVLANLGACHIFHFAGHGESDPRDPSKSRLLLEDWEESPLTVGDLQEHRVQNDPPFLGYLSACSTASNRVDRLVDESVHLVSAFQLAGFRHVVGTLWAVSDSHCVDVARIVYETLRDEGLTDLAVCRGLHRAVKHLRLSTSYVKMRGPRDIELLDDEEEEECKVVLGDPALWAPYIHYGV